MTEKKKTKERLARLIVKQYAREITETVEWNLYHFDGKQLSFLLFMFEDVLDVLLKMQQEIMLREQEQKEN